MAKTLFAFVSLQVIFPAFQKLLLEFQPTLLRSYYYALYYLKLFAMSEIEEKSIIYPVTIVKRGTYSYSEHCVVDNNECLMVCEIFSMQ